jgi:hypothetical protein
MIILRMCKSMIKGYCDLILCGKLDVDVLVLGYQIEMMKICNYMMIMYRNV